MKILLINSPIRLDAKHSCIPYGLATANSALLFAQTAMNITVIKRGRAERA